MLSCYYSWCSASCVQPIVSNTGYSRACASCNSMALSLRAGPSVPTRLPVTGVGFTSFANHYAPRFRLRCRQDEDQSIGGVDRGKKSRRHGSCVRNFGKFVVFLAAGSATEKGGLWTPAAAGVVDFRTDGGDLLSPHYGWACCGWGLRCLDPRMIHEPLLAKHNGSTAT